MAVTVTALKRAVDEAYKLRLKDLGRPASENPTVCQRDLNAFRALLVSPTALTILANRLSDRGQAGNEAADNNIRALKLLLDSGYMATEAIEALEWAIDQLTPPELAE